MKVTEMHRRDFDNIPTPHFDYISEPFYSLVIIPTNKIHSSGYRIMHFVAVNKRGEPLFRISGGSDVIDIDGIGGLGDLSKPVGIPKIRPIEGWMIDCLPCGYLRIFCRGAIRCGHGLSSFEIFYEKT